VWYGFIAPAARARTVPLGAAEQAQGVPDPYGNRSKDRVVADFLGAGTDAAKFNDGLLRVIAALK